MDVGEETFEQDVLRRSHEVPVVVDFWADWCGPCHALAPVLEAEVDSRAGQVELAKVDVDANQELAARYGVSGIPAVKGFRGGKIVSEFTGVRSAQGVRDFLDTLLGPSEAERLAAELRESGEAPEVLAALDAGDHERALALLLDEARATSDGDRRDRVREMMVQIFRELGQDDPVATDYRRRLAAALY
jgi:putative thioredoxin